MADEVRVKVLDIDASKSVKSVRDLKSEINDLKGKLLSLDEGTEEYNKTLQECADKTHQLKDIQEQVAKSSQDFGDRMSNVRGVIGGMAGAIGAVTGVLSLMGVEAEKDSKLIKIMVAAMSITSGVQAIDAGAKAFKAITVSIKGATTAAKGFEAALGWVGLALLAIGAVVQLLDTFGTSTKDAAKQTQTAIDNIKSYWEGFGNWMTDFTYSYAGDARKGLEASVDDWAKFITQIGDDTTGLWKESYDEFLKNIKEGTVKTKNYISSQMKDDADWGFKPVNKSVVEGYYEQTLSYLEGVYAKEKVLYNTLSEEEKKISMATMQAIQKEYQAVLAEQDKFMKGLKAYEDKQQKAEEDARKKSQQQAEAARQNRLKAIKDQYNLENATAKIAYNEHEITEQEYYQRLYDNLVRYNGKVKSVQKQTAAELEQMRLAEQEASMKTSEARAKAFEERINHILAIGKKVNQQLSTAGASNANASENSAMSSGIDEWVTKQEEAGLLKRQTMNENYQKWLSDMEYKYGMQRLNRELEILREELNMLETNRQIDLDNEQAEYETSMQILDKKHEEGLISLEEYNIQVAELTMNHNQTLAEIEADYVDARASLEEEITNNELEQSKRRMEQSQKERDAKIANFQKYTNAASSMLSYTSQLISALQANLDTTTKEGFEKNKNYERANATISFLQGLVSAWASAMQLTYPANVIVGAASSALLTGIYAANLAKINSTTLSGSGGGAASANSVTLQSIEHSPTNVRQTTTSSDYEEMNEHQSDTRVYVLASDIEEVTGQRRAQVSNATY